VELDSVALCEKAGSHIAVIHLHAVWPEVIAVKHSIVAALLLGMLPFAAMAKNKKPEVAAAFGSATYVYVESTDGDVFKPGLFPADRETIGEVEDAVRDWNRYKLATKREQAELLIVVRKGRLANGRLGGQPPIGSPLPPNQSPNQAPGHAPGIGGNAGGVETGAEVGPEDDMLRVYMLNSDGKQTGPIWNRSMTDGLDAPQLVLFRQLRDAVERAYPAGAPQPTKP
jgi:hypothetical protein